MRQSHSQISKRKRDAMTTEQKREKEELEQCTFKPKINPIPRSVSRSRTALDGQNPNDVS